MFVFRSSQAWVFRSGKDTSRTFQLTGCVPVHKGRSTRGDLALYSPAPSPPRTRHPRSPPAHHHPDLCLSASSRESRARDRCIAAISFLAWPAPGRSLTSMPSAQVTLRPTTPPSPRRHEHGDDRDGGVDRDGAWKKIRLEMTLCTGYLDQAAQKKQL